MNFFCEIGVENFPAAQLNRTVDMIKSSLLDHLEEVEVLGTHRRLVIFTENFSLKRQEEVNTVGPPYALSIVNGKLTKIGEKFLKSNNIKDYYLYRKGDKEYIAGKREVEEVTIDQSIKTIIKDAIDSCTFSKKMVWNEISFLRPIRYITSFIDSSSLNFKIGSIQSGDYIKIRGEKIIVKGYEDYFNILKESLVLSHRDRLEQMKRELNIDSSLLSHVVNTVESPKAVLCNFDEKFLSLPYEVIRKTIEIHQLGIVTNRNNFYVLCEDWVEDTLVSKGNNSVVLSRLDDAKIFYEEDIKHSIDHFVNLLGDITFQNGLGSMLDKQKRLSRLANSMEFNLSTSIVKAAKICKFDLSTNIVKEKDYAILRGYIGSIYAKLHGVEDSVAKLIEEHYYPRFSEDRYPSTIEGAWLSILDKVDNIVGAAILNKLPTGAKDPMYIRREAIGIVSLIDRFSLDINFSSLFERAISTYSEDIEFESVDLNSLQLFINSRVKSYLQYDSRLINAVERYFNNFIDSRERLEAISKLDIDIFRSIFNRVYKIIRDHPLEMGQINRSILEVDAEYDLVSKIDEMDSISSYSDMVDHIIDIQKEVDAFFDSVVIISDSEDVRYNRLMILHHLFDRINRVGNMAKILQG